MKSLLLILTISLLICNCFAEFMLPRPVSSFLSYFGMIKDAAENEEIQAESNLDYLESEREHDPLELLLISFDGDKLMGAVGNPMLLRQYIRNNDFVDVLFACPKKEEERKSKKAKKEERDPETIMRTLVIEDTYISMVTKYIEKSKTIENASVPNPTQEEHPNQDAILHQEKIKHRGSTEYTAMKLDSDQKKDPINTSDHQKDGATDTLNSIQGELPRQDGTTGLTQESHEGTNSSSWKKNKRKDSSEFTTPENETVSEKNKVDSADKQQENQKSDDSGHNKMEIDSAPIQKIDGADPNKTKAPTSQSGTEKNLTTVRKINRAGDSLTSDTEKFWIQALDDAEKFKCQKPVRAHLLNFPTTSQYKVYIGGFEVLLEKHGGLNYPQFTKLPNEKFKWFWSFTIIFSESKRNVVCVYHEMQYNKDTYSPQINENFDDHDLGRDTMFPNMDISQLYTIQNQKNVFGKLFKEEYIRKKYFDLDAEKFLLRVHLAPLHSFVTPVVRQSAKTYGNVAPMWNSIRNGAWRRVEEYVGILSHVLINVVVITGTYGILNLEGKDIYLSDDDKVPVPLAFWKLVTYSSELEKSRGMLIITSNNPYEDIGNIICEQDKSHIYGWEYIREDDIAKGRTISCEFQSEILQYLPVLNGAQPAKILDLNRLMSVVNNIWEYNEMGEKTSWMQRYDILEKLNLHKNLVDKNIIANDGKIGENLQTEDENKNDKKDPLYPEGVQEFPFVGKLVEM